MVTIDDYIVDDFLAELDVVKIKLGYSVKILVSCAPAAPFSIALINVPIDMPALITFSICFVYIFSTAGGASTPSGDSDRLTE